MKLRAVHVAVPDDGGEAFAVRRRSDRGLVNGRAVAVHEINMVAAGDVVEQRRGPRELELIPAHVRHRQALAVGEAADASRKQAETRDVAFLGRFEQQLHADADTQQGLPQVTDRPRQISVAQPLHAISRGADAGKNHVRGCSQRRRVGRDLRLDAEPLDREAQGRDIGTAAVDDRQPYHNIPFVLGSSVSVMRIAWRNARPTPLKQASIMWCVFSPLTLMLMAAPSVSASERKKCGTSSVGNCPTWSRPNVPSNTKYGRPDRSIATRASASSIGSMKP